MSALAPLLRLKLKRSLAEATAFRKGRPRAAFRARPLFSSVPSASIFYAAVKAATSINSRADRERIHKPCGSHTLHKPQLPPPQLPPLPHHSKLVDAPCD